MNNFHLLHFGLSTLLYSYFAIYWTGTTTWYNLFLKILLAITALSAGTMFYVSIKLTPMMPPYGYHVDAFLTLVGIFMWSIWSTVDLRNMVVKWAFFIVWVSGASIVIPQIIQALDVL